MQSAVTANVHLRDQLAALETSLETPLVPGEFERWLKTVREELAKLNRLLPAHIRDNHHPQLQEIAEQDREMFARVSSLRQDDDKSLERLAWFQEWGARLADRTALTEPDEAKLDDEFAEFTKQGLDFVIHVRKQELAFTTWLGEAFNRERGEGPG